MATPFLIGITGASCSGKTTIAERLVAALDDARHLALDSYYNDLSQLPVEKVAQHNLDEPAALDADLLFSHIAELAAGRAIDRPVYDYRTHTRAAQGERFEPGRFIIVEGLFTLYWTELRRHLSVGVFVEASHTTCLDRRIRRDLSHRSGTREEIVRRYNEMVAPMFDRYVLPTRDFADLVVDGHGAIDDAVNQVLAHTQRKPDRSE